MFICSGGTVEFIRAYAQAAYGIPPERVIGTVTAMRFEPDARGGVLRRSGEVVPPINDRAGKPVSIQRFIGRRPILAFGNSDGDIEMLEFAASDTRPHLGLLLHHDDAKREYAYDHGAEAALKLAESRGWQVVSVKASFKTVFVSAPPSE